ncbi:GerMN domain-containing protein [Streptomyces chattanoogensis]|uniref:GerMN domain-containing protein n=1 Tax=Streptomyces chattanoogensis TaxID=66876 RepID=UPI0006B564AE|nr:GerMN domain-containing protein [Streptomyces chattanoogensis]
MRPRAASAPLLALCLASLTACGIDDTGPAGAGAPASGLPRAHGRPAAAVHVYFSSPRGLERVSRLDDRPDILRAAMRQLVAGPDPAERARGLVSLIPPGTPVPTAVTPRPGMADVRLPPRWTANRTALHQLVCTVADAAATTHGTEPQDTRVRLHRPGGGEPTTEGCARP